jgi:hypothetical protein
MIFEDQSGKRWRRIKVGGAVLVGAAGAGVVTVLAATIAFLPHWQALNVPVLSEVGGAAEGALSNAIKPPAFPTAGSPTPSSAPIVPGGGSPSRATVATAAETNSPAPAVTQASEPVIGKPATPSPAPSPTSAPGNSGFGHSHR